MYLLDTNVVSELRKAGAGRADPTVTSWAASVDPAALYLSVITVMELEIGILRVERRDSAQGVLLRNWLEHQVLPAFAGRILSIDLPIDPASADFRRLYSFDAAVGGAPRSSVLHLGNADFLGTAGVNSRCGYGSLYRYKGDGTSFEANDDRCGRRRNDQGGGSGGPALLLVLTSLAWLRRRPH